MAAGTLHSLPSPVLRKHQKTVKSEWFDVLRKTKEAGDQVEGIQSWLTSRLTGDVHNSDVGTHWTKYLVETELGGVLKLGLPCGEVDEGVCS